MDTDYNEYEKRTREVSGPNLTERYPLMTTFSYATLRAARRDPGKYSLVGRIDSIPNRFDRAELIVKYNIINQEPDDELRNRLFHQLAIRDTVKYEVQYNMREPPDKNTDPGTPEVILRI